jgi:glutamate formiminotransferase/glutamate formiminotransferase/formiminotetrahydrofolate cyclodeaminase
MEPPTLLAVPNVSEGRDEPAIAEIGRAFSAGDAIKLLDVHSDGDHHRSVFTLAAPPRELSDALLRGARAAVEGIDVMGRVGDPGEAGQHPHVGAVDVVPVVYLDQAARGAACAEALVVADRLGEELEVPVFLYGDLSASGAAPGRTRAELRRGGVALLAERIAAARRLDAPETEALEEALEWLRPDFGPPRMHVSAGATLVAARPPLVAFNLQLGPPATLADARRIAGLIREGGAEGLPGVRAIGIALSGDVAQVSMNVERPFELPLASIVEAVGRHARVASAELVGLAPRAAFEGFPEDVPIPGFDPARHLIENAIGC